MALDSMKEIFDRMEQEGIIGGYTVRLHHPGENNRVQTLISIQTAASERDHFLKMIQGEPQILQCYRVTGSYNFIVKVSCPGIDALEHLLTHLQKMGNQHPDHSCHTAGPQSEPGRGRINGIAYL